MNFIKKLIFFSTIFTLGLCAVLFYFDCSRIWGHYFLLQFLVFFVVPAILYFIILKLIHVSWKKFYTQRIEITRDSQLFYVPAVKKDKLNPAVIICPGGSYHHLGMTVEGFYSAKWFSLLGIDSFVLRYRTAFNDHHYPEQFQDIDFAVTYLRSNCEKYAIDPQKIGAIGYSAGGHLVMTSALNHDKNKRPNFVMPIYPVVSMQDDIGHKWSRRSLFLRKVTQEQKDLASIEKHIFAEMPPVFLMACQDDNIVKFENSLVLEKSLADKNVSHNFVQYKEGGHGFGMKNGWFMKKYHWNDEKLLPWLKKIGVIE